MEKLIIEKSACVIEIKDALKSLNDATIDIIVDYNQTSLEYWTGICTAVVKHLHASLKKSDVNDKRKEKRH